MKRAIYKARVDILDDGKVKVISYCNRLIPPAIFKELNESIHAARERINNEAPWKQTFIRFDHEGHTYYQINNTGIGCVGCVFHRNEGGIGCQHPHYLEGTKGNCIGKIYKEEK